jgi:hypothetical protein
LLNATREIVPIKTQIPKYVMSSDDEDDLDLFDKNLIPNKTVTPESERFVIASDDEEDDDLLDTSIAKFHQECANV